MGLRSAGLGSGGSGRNLAALIGGAWNGLPISGRTMPARAGGKRAGWGRRGAPGVPFLLTPTDTLLTGGVSVCKVLKHLIFLYSLTCRHPFCNIGYKSCVVVDAAKMGVRGVSRTEGRAVSISYY
jgi:hypothetical protein